MATVSILCFILSITFTIVLAENENGEARIGKIPFGVIVFHSVTAITAVLVIIKIILAISFVGMLSVLFHTFSGLKNLLNIDHHGHEHFLGHDGFIGQEDYPFPGGYQFPAGYSFPGYDTKPTEEPASYAYRRADSLEGGRDLKNPILQNHNLNRRNVKNVQSKNKHRITRRSTHNSTLR